VFLRQFEYLDALARERHFGRAASACHVSQSALSSAIQKLEQELGLPLVKRAQRYDDLTPEGHALLGWTRQTLTSLDGLRSEAARLRGELEGTLRLGAIPTALPAVAFVTADLLDRHPHVRVSVHSLSSQAILRGLDAHELDAGLTYLDEDPPATLHVRSLYHERYLLLCPEHWLPEAAAIPWSKLEDLPLCLLASDMQHRRVVDDAIAAGGGEPVAPRVEANSLTALLAFARAGWACVVAHTWLALQGPLPGMRALPLEDPVALHAIGLVRPARTLPHPILTALERELDNVDLERALDSSR
jgi:DNA-binding transcriptional LysR family regulator